MKSLINIIFPFLILSSIIYAQQTDEKTILNDSLKFNSGYNSLLQMQIKFEEFELHRELNYLKMNIPIDGDPKTIWLRTSIAVSSTNNSDKKFSPHFLSPLEQKYYEDSKFDPFRYALGMVQAGAVGYLAYKHIKKYGFLK